MRSTHCHDLLPGNKEARILRNQITKTPNYVENFKGYLPFASTWMELEGIMLSEVSRSERQSSYGFTHTGYIKNSERDCKGKDGK